MLLSKVSDFVRYLRKQLLSDSIQRLRESTVSTPWARGLGILVFLAIGLCCEMLLLSHERQAEAERRTAASAYANNLRTQVDRELNGVLYLSSGLSSYLVVRHDKLDRLELYKILANLYGSNPHIHNFSIAEGYQVRYVYPVQGNEKVLGLDYQKTPAQLPLVQKAIESVRGTLAGPLDLVQGGSGLIYRVPVFVDNVYWGLLSTVIDTDSLFNAAFDGVHSEQYEFAIRGRNGLGAQGDVFWGNPAIFADPAAITVDSVIPNGTWVYAARAKTMSNQPSLIWFLRGAGWAMAALLGIAVTTLLLQRAELAHQAGFDNLTGLPNRRLLNDRLEQAVRRHERQAGDRIGVLFIDLDGFKQINDQHGHKAGDAALRTAAQRIRKEIRLSDTVARWGGDEFVAVIENADDVLMQHLRFRLRQSIEIPFEFHGAIFRMSASIGSAMLSAAIATPEALLELADRRMFEEKQNRKAA